MPLQRLQERNLSSACRRRDPGEIDFLLVRSRSHRSLNLSCSQESSVWEEWTAPHTTSYTQQGNVQPILAPEVTVLLAQLGSGKGRKPHMCPRAPSYSFLLFFHLLPFNLSPFTFFSLIFTSHTIWAFSLLSCMSHQFFLLSLSNSINIILLLSKIFSTIFLSFSYHMV